MKKKLFKYGLATFILAIGFLTFSTSVNALQFINYYGIHMTNDEYTTLLNLGFTDDDIYYMDEATFEENRYDTATLVASNTKYLKTVYPMYGASYTVEVSQAEYLNQGTNQPLGTVITEYKQLISTISYRSNVNKYRYKVDLSWRNIPSNKSYDVIGIGFMDDVYIDSSVYFSYYYSDAYDNTISSTVYYDKKSTSTGGSAVYKLPTTFYGLSAKLYYDVSKDTNDTITSLEMCGDYAHSTVTVTSTQAANHVINFGGIDMDNSVTSNFDEIDCAESYVSVNW